MIIEMIKIVKMILRETEFGLWFFTQRTTIMKNAPDTTSLENLNKVAIVSTVIAGVYFVVVNFMF